MSRPSPDESAFHPLRTLANNVIAGVVKVYALLPNLEIFDGSGLLSSDASRVLDVIASIVADSLRQGGDHSHRAIVWDDGPIVVGIPPLVLDMPDRDSLIAVTKRCLNPHELFGGDIRSALNCRMVTFGYDGQAYLTLRHDDQPPRTHDATLVTIDGRSEWLAETDWFDGAWPNT